MTLLKAERRLSAILVADVVGYSRLVETDESGTLAAIKELRNTLLRPLLAEHHGRIVKLMGDGLIAEFRSVVGAVACAAALQLKVAEGHEGVPPERRISLRIGINLGDVVVEGGDLLGDGVNVAARLEQLCPPGGVLISGAAHDQISGKLDVRFEFTGEQHLKHIARPIRAYRMVLDGTAPATLPILGTDRPIIAVLPFDNMSSDPEQVYFSDGMTEEVITELSRFRELMVIARNSSFAFRGQSMDVREIGRQLGAAYIVEGSVRRADQRVRIAAQLVEAATGAHLWADRYDRSIEDVFAIQEEIARGIVANVAQRVGDESRMTARRRPPEDLRAYDLYIQGNHATDEWRPEAQALSEKLFQEARRIDPSFARAYAGLAYIHLNRALEEGMWVPGEPDEHRLAALRFAEEALALDPNDPRVHSILGFTCFYLRQFVRAERHLDLARTMNPNDPTIQIVSGWVQGCLGRPEQGLAAAELASRLNPRHPAWYESIRGRMLFLLGRHAEAAPRLESLNFPHAPLRHLRDVAWLAAAYGHLGRIEDARRRGESFLLSAASLWRGNPGAGPAEYVDWLVDVSFLQQEADIEKLRGGLRLAGLPG
jgi:adenylate cyclase